VGPLLLKARLRLILIDKIRPAVLLYATTRKKRREGN